MLSSPISPADTDTLRAHGRRPARRTRPGRRYADGRPGWAPRYVCPDAATSFSHTRNPSPATMRPGRSALRRLTCPPGVPRPATSGTAGPQSSAGTHRTTNIRIGRATSSQAQNGAATCALALDQPQLLIVIDFGSGVRPDRRLGAIIDVSAARCLSAQIVQISRPRGREWLDRGRRRVRLSGWGARRGRDRNGRFRVSGVAASAVVEAARADPPAVRGYIYPIAGPEFPGASRCLVSRYDSSSRAASLAACGSVLDWPAVHERA
jgi:hypothetical protein